MFLLLLLISIITIIIDCITFINIIVTRIIDINFNNWITITITTCQGIVFK